MSRLKALLKIFNKEKDIFEREQDRIAKQEVRMKAYYNERTRRLEFRDDAAMGRKIKFVILTLPVLFLIIVALFWAVGVTPEPPKKAATIEINDILHHSIDKRGNIIYENKHYACRVK